MLMCKVRFPYFIPSIQFSDNHCDAVCPDSTLSVAISGDTGEARALQRATQPEQSGEHFTDACSLLIKLKP